MTRILIAIAALFLLATPGLSQQRTQYILAVSWQPAFCEGNENRAECTSQAPDSFEASHFTLHGLWSPRANYCGVIRDIQFADKDGQWDLLPPPQMSDATRKKLDQMMPGAKSNLDRHEWIKHGTCYGEQPDPYFSDALAMLDAVNASPVRELFAQNVGKELTQEQVRAAFDKAFGKGAGQRVRLACNRDGERRLLVEMTIGLTGEITAAADFSKLILAARPTDGGCSTGIVDPVGIQ